MKASRFLRTLAVTAATALTAAGLAAVAIAPADAATKSTLIIGEGVGFDSLNPNHPDHNSTANSDIASLTNAGFWYYDDATNLKRNTKLGSYTSKMNGKTFEISVKLNSGLLWSDGTAIDGVDLLLSNIISSSAYSIKAGLGDPASDAGSKFVSAGYSGSYDRYLIGLPVLSADHMTVTYKFKQYLPSWETTTPGLFPAHTLEALADGKKALQSASENKALKAKFLSDYTKAYAGDSTAKARLAKMGDIWSESYNLNSSFTSTDNPLLVVSSGPYIFKSFNVDTTTETLVLNSKYNAGPALPKTNPIKTVVYKYVADGTASVQALQNGDINLYQGMPGAAGYSTLKSLAASKSIALEGGSQASYEHIDLRAGNGQGTTTDYTGPFAATRGQKAKDLRLAFLLAYPRYNAMLTQLKPFNSKGALMNSSQTLPGSKYYNTAVKVSGITANKTVTIGGVKYTYNFNVTSDSQQARNEAVALKLVQKYYPDASATKPAVKINLLRSTRQMRVENNALVVAHEANAGFDVTNVATPGWSAKLGDNSFDVAMFAWSFTSIKQDGGTSLFASDGSQNQSGWLDTSLDGILHQLEGKLTDAQVATLMGKADKILLDNAYTLPVYQWPMVTAYTTGLKGIKPGPISPNINWNYWEWHY